MPDRKEERQPASEDHSLRMVPPGLRLKKQTAKARERAFAVMDVSVLEVQLQSKLDLSRIVRSIASRSNFAEVSTGEVGGAADRDDAVATESRSVEVWMIENVEELRPELQAEALIKLEIFEG